MSEEEILGVSREDLPDYVVGDRVERAMQYFDWDGDKPADEVLIPEQIWVPAIVAKVAPEGLVIGYEEQDKIEMVRRDQVRLAPC